MPCPAQRSQSSAAGFSSHGHTTRPSTLPNRPCLQLPTSCLCTSWSALWTRCSHPSSIPLWVSKRPELLPTTACLPARPPSAISHRCIQLLTPHACGLDLIQTAEGIKAPVNEKAAEIKTTIVSSFVVSSAACLVVGFLLGRYLPRGGGSSGDQGGSGKGR